jgi:hypothetical protein
MSRLPYRLIALAFAAALAASCSTLRISYDHADWLLARMAAQYVDLDKAQARALRTQLGGFHAWHRRQELPRYAVLFDAAASRVERGLGASDIDWLIGAMRERTTVLGARAGGEFAPVLAMLSERQVRQMEERFEEDNRKFIRTQLAGDRTALAEKRERWLCGQFENFLGQLTPAQRARIRTLVQAFPEMPGLRLEERKRRQQVLVRLVRENADVAQLDAALSKFLADPDAGRADSNRQAMQRWERAFRGTLLDLDRSLSSEQRRNAVARLRGYAADLRQLAAESGATAAAGMVTQ